MGSNAASVSAEKLVRRTLHSIVSDMLDLIDEAGGEITPAVAPKLDAISGELEDKVQAYCAVMRQLAGEASMLEDLAHDYKQRAAVREAAIEGLKFRLDAELKAAGIQKLKTPSATVYYQNSTSVHVESERDFLGTAEDRFVVVKQSVNKTAIKEALEAGETVEGAELRTSRHLRFR